MESQKAIPEQENAPSAPIMYPSLDAIPPSFRVESDFIKQVQQSRVRELEKLQEELNESLAHYKKIKKRWTHIDSGIKITGVVLASITASISAIIAPFNLATIASVLAAVSAGKAIFTQTFSVGFTSKKVKQYREITEQINYSITKLYLFNQKALKDDIISIEEIKEAYNIFNNLKKDINKIKRSLKS